ncbi:LysR family transcriptional regulator [Sphingomonas oleivorans]|uniref:LysR family transcriptional regulator n=1 Tax=Sphingomonas oleivorans TaxID=1735121 RepID=A0A2T5FZT8_9SPHN|nr:LysR family transcriptional regulator [Sphingomonas oleivorans]PTQ12219.1 LysR family transcriptional regulator [Sphingomonas oleivorans]
MIKLEGVSAFTAIVDAGSISSAARHLGKPKSVVSDRLAELERELGTRLIQRTTRNLSLTEDGETFLPRARRILRETIEAAAELSERRGTLAGPLRISAPVGFGILHLGRALNSFLAAHREIDLALDLNDNFVDAAADGFDAVLRIGAIADNRLVAKRLATTRRVMVASPDYLAANGTPAGIAELEAHHGILYANRESDWRFAGKAGWTVARPRAVLRVNNGLVMRDATVAGLGISLLPSFYVNEELRRGSLILLDLGLEAERAELFVVYPRDRNASAKVLALIDSLRKSFGDPPYWDCAAGPVGQFS